MLFSKFLQEIQNDNFLKCGDEVIVAVSGGADSVCLLHLMVRLRDIYNLNLICAHVNHSLRPEADEDENFVRSLCEKWDVSFVSHKADVGKKALDEKISVELAGREVRYAFFKSLEKDAIVTAHTKNDAVESNLLHLIRGCGLKGLCGIPKIREDKVYRPLLPFTKEEIVFYLKQNEILWREDSSNFNSVYTRNKIRNEILPLILEINPSFVDTADKMISVLREENSFLEDVLSGYAWKKTVGNVLYISVAALLSMPPAVQKRALSKVLDSYDEVTNVLALIHKENGKRLSLSGGKTAEKEYDSIAVYANDIIRPASVKLSQSGETVFGNYSITVGKEGLALPKNEYTVRCREKGDVFSPEGLKGHKKLKDFLNEKKIPQRFRDELPIITLGDKIVSVSDMRRDNAFLPKDNNVIHIKIRRLDNV